MLTIKPIFVYAVTCTTGAAFGYLSWDLNFGNRILTDPS